MDTHLLIKIIHMSAVSFVILVFVLRAATLLIVVTGVTLLVMNEFKVQPWFYAKIVLFLVLLSSQIKAYKKDESILLTQRRAGIVVGAIALIGLMALVMIKPVFG